MSKYNYFLGENYLKTQKNLYCIKAYNIIGSLTMEISVYSTKQNRFTINTMTTNNFITGHIHEVKGVLWMYGANKQLKNVSIQEEGLK